MIFSINRRFKAENGNRLLVFMLFVVSFAFVNTAMAQIAQRSDVAKPDKVYWVVLPASKAVVMDHARMESHHLHLQSLPIEKLPLKNQEAFRLDPDYIAFMFFNKEEKIEFQKLYHSEGITELFRKYKINDRHVLRTTQ